MRRVYIETSVWVMSLANQPPQLRDATKEFLRKGAERLYLPHISPVVTEEIERAREPEHAAVLQMLREVKPVILPLPPSELELAQKFIDTGILTHKRMEDARHVSCAIVNGIDLLVSWNYRHIANVRKAERFNAVAVLAGYADTLAIHTPLEVLEWT